MIELLTEAISKKSDSKGVLVDGCPANLEQAQLIEKIVGPPGKIIFLDLKDTVMKLRLKSRHNFDDEDDAVMKRINAYNDKTKPVVAAYSESVIKVGNYYLCPFPYLVFPGQC